MPLAFALTVSIVGLLLIPVMIVLSVVPFVHMAYAAHKVNQGVDYRYPLVADFIGAAAGAVLHRRKGKDTR
jgi:uncharacterized protein